MKLVQTDCVVTFVITNTDKHMVWLLLVVTQKLCCSLLFTIIFPLLILWNRFNRSTPAIFVRQATVQ